VRILIPPFAADEVERALRALHMAPLLQGIRGEPPLDVPAFCDAAVKISRLMLDDAWGVLSLDLNPVMVAARGEGCLVVDALALCSAGAVSSAERSQASHDGEISSDRVIKSGVVIPPVIKEA
jgi:acetate---CoA ligase (ADP-forming)